MSLNGRTKGSDQKSYIIFSHEVIFSLINSLLNLKIEKFQDYDSYQKTSGPPVHACQV